MRWTLVLVMAAGCATPRAASVAWPNPPAVERVRLVRTLSGQGDLDGPLARFWRNLSGAEAPVRLYHPVGVAVTAEGDLLAVTDQALSQLFLFDFSSAEVRTVSKETLGGAPVGVALEGDVAWVVVPSRRAALSFSRRGEARRLINLDDCERPVGLALDVAHDRLFVSDASSPQGQGHTVHAHALSTGAHLATVGKRGDGAGEFFFPTFLATSLDGLFVADTMNSRVQELDAAGRFVRQFGERGDQVGQFDKPKGIATDSFGNVYVVDSFFSVVQIFNREGKLLLFFGGRGDSPGFLSNPAGIAIDAHNRIYVTNALNFRVEVYELVNTSAADSGLSVLTAGR